MLRQISFNKPNYIIEYDSGPGKYDIQGLSQGPRLTIAIRNDTFDQKCNDNPGKRNIHVSVVVSNVNVRASGHATCQSKLYVQKYNLKFEHMAIRIPEQ